MVNASGSALEHPIRRLNISRKIKVQDDSKVVNQRTAKETKDTVLSKFSHRKNAMVQILGSPDLSSKAGEVSTKPSEGLKRAQTGKT